MPLQLADLAAQAHTKREKHDERFTYRGQGGSMPVAQMHSQMTKNHRAALPMERRAKDVENHDFSSLSSAKNMSSKVGGRTS